MRKQKRRFAALLITVALFCTACGGNGSTEQNNAKQTGLEQNNTEQTDLEQNNTEQDNFEQNSTEQDNAKQDNLEETVSDPLGETDREQGADNDSAGTPFAEHGKLSVKGTNLCDSKGEPYRLKGVSTNGIAWFPQFVNREAFVTVRDWGGNLIRLSLYTGEYNGYLNGGDQEYLKQLVDTGVQAASELGMYVIIDWHILSDGNPNTNKEAAKVFFQEMTEKYADYGNVLYEICNEPNGNVTWEDVKAYAEEIIPVIRANAPEAVIIVGTPTWSQDVDIAAENPLEGDNLMYACHFYAATHGQELRDKVQHAMDAGLPVFISEYSICEASGDGAIDYEEAEKWAQFIDDNRLSYAQWNLANKAEASSMIRSDCQKTAGWEDSDLTESGLWLKGRLGGN